MEHGTVGDGGGVVTEMVLKTTAADPAVSVNGTVFQIVFQNFFSREQGIILTKLRDRQGINISQLLFFVNITNSKQLLFYRRKPFYHSKNRIH